MKRVLQVAAGMAKKTGKDVKEAPLFPNAAGEFIEKADMVAYFQAAGKVIGIHKGITGHAPRVSGARRMTRAGIELWQIQLFAKSPSQPQEQQLRQAPKQQPFHQEN